MTTDTINASQPTPMRSAVRWIGWAKTALLVAGAIALVAVGGYDRAERSTAGIFVGLAVVYGLVFILPALLLARWNRLLGLALCLLLVPPPLIALLFIRL